MCETEPEVHIRRILAVTDVLFLLHINDITIQLDETTGTLLDIAMESTFELQKFILKPGNGV